MLSILNKFYPQNEYVSYYLLSVILPGTVISAAPTGTTAAGVPNTVAGEYGETS